MSPTGPDEEQRSGIRAVDHWSATTTRKGEIVGFGESDGRGRAASGDWHASGLVTFQIAGSSPRGEEGALAACQRLIHHINLESNLWEAPTEVVGIQHIDAVSLGVGKNSGNKLTIQVVRALTDPAFWKSLGRNGSASISVTVPEAAEYLKDAILFKVDKIPSAVCASLTLALDATDVPALSFHPVIEAFNQKHGNWVDTQGFASIWVIGPEREMVSHLGAKA
ncbi:MAG: hypothetical protein WBN85_08925 [Candidatus Macondimonas sp.]